MSKREPGASAAVAAVSKSLRRRMLQHAINDYGAAAVAAVSKSLRRRSSNFTAATGVAAVAAVSKSLRRSAA